MKVCGFTIIKEWLEPGGYVQYVAGLHLKHSKPPVSPKNIIFPFSFKNKTFETSHYHEFQTEEKIRTSEINTFLSGIEEILLDNFQGLKPITALDWAFMVLVALVIIAGLIIVLVFGSKTIQIGAIILAVILLVLLEGITFVIIVKRAVKRTRKQVNLYVNRISHQEIFHSRGFKWVIPADFPIWVELAKIGSALNEGRLVYGTHSLPFHKQGGLQHDLSSESLLKNNHSATGPARNQYM